MNMRLLSSLLVAGFLFFGAVHPAHAQGFEPSFEEGMAAFNYGDNELALRHFLRLSNDGDMRAQYYLAYMMDSGLGMGKDVYGSANWYLKSATQGYMPAMVYAGYIYSAGHGVTVDKKKAFDWYTQAAQMGDAVAQNNLGVMLREGDPYAANKPLSAQWFLQSAMQGNMRAQYNLANMYRLGDGIKVNIGEAMKWYTYAANQGDQYAQYALGYMYFTAARDLQGKVDAAKASLANDAKITDEAKAKLSDADKGKLADDIKDAQSVIDTNTPELETDKQQALEWFRRSAEQGHTGAQIALAKMYETGEGGPDKGIIDAIAWLTQAADAGKPEAMRRLGLVYEGKVKDWNDKGITPDYKLAFKWLRKAAEEKDDKLAMVEIGQMYASGVGDVVRQDTQKALKWYEHAAETGDPTGEMYVAMAYENGNGVQKSPREAYKWYSLAVKGYQQNNDTDGLTTAVKKRIGIQLDPMEKGDVDREVNAWQPVTHGPGGAAKKERPLFYDDK
jgi:TPR repeat protein